MQFLSPPGRAIISRCQYECQARTAHTVLKGDAGAPHGLADTHNEQLNEDLLAFISPETSPAAGAHVWWALPPKVM
jgi:hypothetical protein